MGKVGIRFIRQHSPYNVGERAGFDPVEAERLVNEGVAVPLERASSVEEAGVPQTPVEVAATPLPEDFPGREALLAAGHETVEAVAGIEDLTEIEGIGPATAKKIAEALES